MDPGTPGASDPVDEQIRGLLRARRMRGDFAAIHPAPGRPGDVPDAAGGRDDLAMRASRELREAGSLYVDYPAERLRADLDAVPLWPPGADQVSLAEVWDAYARTLGLPRLRSSAVLAAAVLSGISRPD